MEKFFYIARGSLIFWSSLCSVFQEKKSEIKFSFSALKNENEKKKKKTPIKKNSSKNK